ncbi:hypothetical protein [Rhizobium sp. PAMB 3182]
MVKKALAHIQPGELLRYDFGSGASIMMMLEKREEERHGVFGVLSSPDFGRHMSFYLMDLGGNCLSYGEDWFLEEIHGDETVVAATRPDASLFINEYGPVFVFRPPKGASTHMPACFGVLRREILVGFDRRSNAPIAEWRIWESQEHFTRQTGPIFEMKPMSQSGPSTLSNS